jgi:hypothetical protein
MQGEDTVTNIDFSRAITLHVDPCCVVECIAKSVVAGAAHEHHLSGAAQSQRPEPCACINNVALHSPPAQRTSYVLDGPPTRQVPEIIDARYPPDLTEYTPSETFCGV